MRVTLISDIHGNLTALNAVLSQIRQDGADQIICRGDIPAFGPHPHEVIDRLGELGCVAVKGNTDASIVDPTLGAEVQELAGDQRRIGDIYLWGAERLTSADLAFIWSLAATTRTALAGGRELLCFHGLPRSCREAITVATTEADLDGMTKGFRADLLNPGAVGLPKGLRKDAIRLAEYAIITSNGSDLDVSLRRCAFDRGDVIRAARAQGMPHADWWASSW